MGGNMQSDFYLTNENGNDVHLTLVGYADLDGKVYMICTPFDRKEKDNSKPAAVFFRVKKEKDSFVYESVSDKALCEKIMDRFVEIETENQ